MQNIKRNRLLIILLISLGVIIAIGIYINPAEVIKRKRSGLRSDLQESISGTQDLIKMTSESKDCLEFTSIKETNFNECISTIQRIQNNFKTLNKESLEKYENFYIKQNGSLDEKTNKFLENTIILYKSDAHALLMSSYDEYFSASLKLHSFLSKDISLLSAEELKQGTILAENFNLESKKLQYALESYNNFIRNNFEDDFVNTMLKAEDGLKESIK